MKKIEIQAAGYGHFRVTVGYRGKQYSAVTTNTRAIDRYNNDDISKKRIELNYTQAQAAKALYKEVKRAHSLR